MVSFRPVVEPTPLPKSKRLIITIATEISQKILAETAESMKRYAAKCGADFIAITNCTQDWPLAEKFRLAHYAGYYERVLFLDSDVFVRNSAPNIFEEVPAGVVAMHDDTPSLLRSGNGVEWLRSELEIICKSQKWSPQMAAFCLNSGVVLFDGADAGIWSPPEYPFPTFHCAEQDVVQIRAAATNRIFFLNEKWNWQYWVNPTLAGIEHAHFVHLSGMSQSNPTMQIPILRALALTP